MIPDLLRLELQLSLSLHLDMRFHLREWLRVEISGHIVVQNLAPVISLFGQAAVKLAGKLRSHEESHRTCGRSRRPRAKGR